MDSIVPLTAEVADSMMDSIIDGGGGAGAASSSV